LGISVEDACRDELIKDADNERRKKCEQDIIKRKGP
jgi:hypothetical protein